MKNVFTVVIVLMLFTTKTFAQLTSRGYVEYPYNETSKYRLEIFTKHSDGEMFYIIHCSPQTNLFENITHNYNSRILNDAVNISVAKIYTDGVSCGSDGRDLSPYFMDTQRSMEELKLIENSLRNSGRYPFPAFNISFIDEDGFELISFTLPINEFRDGVVKSVSKKNANYYQGKVDCSKNKYKSISSGKINKNF